MAFNMDIEGIKLVFIKCVISVWYVWYVSNLFSYGFESSEPVERDNLRESFFEFFRRIKPREGLSATGAGQGRYVGGHWSVGEFCRDEWFESDDESDDGLSSSWLQFP